MWPDRLARDRGQIGLVPGVYKSTTKAIGFTTPTRVDQREHNAICQSAYENFASEEDYPSYFRMCQ